jgi:DNA modification methylase
MIGIETIESDCRPAMRRMIGEGRRFHSIVTDPPYRLISIVKRFGKKDAAAAKHGTDGRFTRLGKGFMGQTWDESEIANDPRVWRLCLDLLLPGGILMAFSSPKTGHRMACAIEDAGFIMHPLIGWVYGQGMPKAHAVRKEGSAVPAEWEGWYHGGQTLKPSLEPVYVAQRPYSERTAAANVIRHGAGGFNIDAGRVPGGAGDDLDRWPPNVAHDGSPVVLPLFPLDGQGKPTARYFPAFHYHAKANGQDRAGSDHPTVKPIGYLRWLIRLGTPPGGIVLDPFAGSGSTGEAALAEGMRCVLIEKEPDYVADTRRRIGLLRGADLI